VAFVLGTYATHALTHDLGMVVAVAATIAWLAVSRADLTDLIKTLSGIVGPKLPSLRRT